MGGGLIIERYFSSSDLSTIELKESSTKLYSGTQSRCRSRNKTSKSAHGGGVAVVVGGRQVLWLGVVHGVGFVLTVVTW
jgi:hypothetical protein